MRPLCVLHYVSCLVCTAVCVLSYVYCLMCIVLWFSIVFMCIACAYKLRHGRFEYSLLAYTLILAMDCSFVLSAYLSCWAELSWNLFNFPDNWVCSISLKFLIGALEITIILIFLQPTFLTLIYHKVIKSFLATTLVSLFERTPYLIHANHRLSRFPTSPLILRRLYCYRTR